MVIHYNIQKYRDDINFAHSIKMRNVIKQHEIDMKSKEMKLCN